jgi:hypothetical protein
MLLRFVNEITANFSGGIPLMLHFATLLFEKNNSKVKYNLYLLGRMIWRV